MHEGFSAQENIPENYKTPSLPYEDFGYESALSWREAGIEYRDATTKEPAEFPLVNPIEQEDFDRQFSDRQTLDHRDKTTNPVDIVDVSPGPERTKTNVPLMIAPGFSEGPQTLKENMRYFSGWGRRVLTYDAPYGISPEFEEYSSLKQAAKIETYEVGKAATINRVLEQKELGRVDAVGHSEGCINLIIAALEHPDRFRNLILVNPGGMVGSTTTFEFVKRVWRHFYAEKKALSEDPHMYETKTRSKHERIHNIFADPQKSLRAARAVVCSEIGDLLTELKGHDIGISIIHGVDDVLFPMDKIQGLANRGQFDGFYSVKGGHNDFFLNPASCWRPAGWSRRRGACPRRLRRRIPGDRRRLSSRRWK
jgi:pimeloyl-ACP methyl ester carboxylesterase